MIKPLFNFPTSKDYIVKPVSKHTESTFRDICTIYIPQAVEQTKRVSKLFSKYGKREMIYIYPYIFEFCKESFMYQDDKKGFEQIRLPNKLWADGVGDCEDFVIFCSSILINKGISHTIRMADYGQGWQHIYIKIDKIVLDPCDKKFNAKEKKGKFLDYEINPKTYLKSKKLGLGRIGINPEKSRIEGKFIENGNQYKRQGDIQNQLIQGIECDVSFSLDVEVKGYYALISAELLQPSHLGNIENPLHFIPEAQPRNRAFSESGAKTPELIAQKLRPAEICEGSTAYAGCPIINIHGEVIQGNGRAFTMKFYWEQFQKDPKNYLKYLSQRKNAFFEPKYQKDFLHFQYSGISSPAEISQANGTKIINPILVRVVNCNDEQAIVLGQYKQSDLEAVSTVSNQTKSKVNQIDGALLNQILNTLFPEGSQNQEKTLSELIRESSVSSLLIRKGIIRNDEFLENYVNQRTGQINADGVKMITDLLVGLIFKGMDTNTPELFRILPDRVQTALAKSAKFILDSTDQTSIKVEISNAIRGTNSYLIQKELGYSFKSWITQSSIFGNSTPAQEYNALELALIELFANSTTQIQIIQKFKEYWNLTTPKQEINSVFGNLDTPSVISKSDAISKVFGVKIQAPQQNQSLFKIKIRQRQAKAKLLLMQL